MPHADRRARRRGGRRRACLPGAPCAERGTKTLNPELLIWSWLTLIVEHGIVEAGGALAFQARPVLTGDSEPSYDVSEGGVPHAD